MRGRGWSVPAGVRLAALAAAAVALPVGLLCVLQYRSLLELHSRTRAAVQDNLRQSLQAVARGVEDRVRLTALDSLLALRLADVRRDRVEVLGRQFTAIKRAHPEVDQLMVVSQCDCQGGPFAVVWAGQGARLADCNRAVGDGLDRTLASAVSRAMWAFAGSLPVWTAATGGEELTAFQDSGAGSSTLYVFRKLSPKGVPRAEAVFAGLTLGPDYLTGQLLPGAAAEVLRGAELSLSVTEDHKVEVWGSEPKARRTEVTVSLGPLFPLWELSIGYRGTTIQELARRQLWRNFLLAGVVVGCLILGLALMLRTAAREARLAELKSAFVSNVSHEIKTPLALIRMLAETLELGRVTAREKIAEYHRLIHSESRRLSRLIDNILDFARMEAGRKECQFAPADVASLVEDVVRSYEEQIVGAGFELTLDIERPLPPLVIDAGAISQAVLNILSNAVKYSAEVKKIAVRVGRQDGRIAVEITDHGIGIPRSEQRRIFEKFYRVGNGLVHDTKGSGLGLTLSKHIVEAHGGRILLESAPGRGSRFTILLPAPEAVPASEPAPGEQPVAHSADRRG